MENNILRKSIMVTRGLFLPSVHKGKESWQKVVDLIDGDKPFMMGRLGATEIKCVLYNRLPPPLSLCLKNHVYTYMPIWSGFFPVTEETIGRFSDLMQDAMLELDVLASWRPEEFFFRKYLRRAYKIAFGEIGPIDDCAFWSKALRGKKVLVVHPFAETIRRQYKTNRMKLWNNLAVLPEFQSLTVIQAAQTIAGNTGGYDSWFEAFDSMISEIEKVDFDVALLGCGAYGFPLAARIKRMGKKAIHMGGSLQILFGIKGRRWDNYGFYNEYWVSPSKEERPAGLQKVEGGCYW